MYVNKAVEEVRVLSAVYKQKIQVLISVRAPHTASIEHNKNARSKGIAASGRGLSNGKQSTPHSGNLICNQCILELQKPDAKRLRSIKLL